MCVGFIRLLLYVLLETVNVYFLEQFDNDWLEWTIGYWCKYQNFGNGKEMLEKKESIGKDEMNVVLF